MTGKKYPVLILAAGLSTRMGFPKLLLAENNELLFERMINNLHLTNWSKIGIVLSVSELSDFVLKRQPDISVIHNQFPERGMISSIRLGLKWAGEIGEGILTLPIDHPLIGRKTFDILHHEASPDNISIPVFQGRRGHPTWWGKAYWNYLNDKIADHGANAVLRLPDVNIKEIPVDDEGVLININTPEIAEQHNLKRYLETND
ncbi:NTP transferase domain-containing protein [bacterium]|nr:NTP transferase domain-containing protein [bacterium]